MFASEPIEEVFDTITDCTKFLEWWPKTYTLSVQECTANRLGSTINFQSAYGDYGATLSQMEKNDCLTFTYDKGIFRGNTHWKLNSLSPRQTQVCYHSNLIPYTAKLRFYSSFVGDEAAKSYFEPLLDSLEQKFKKTSQNQ